MNYHALPLNAIDNNFNGSPGSLENQWICHYAIHAIEITVSVFMLCLTSLFQRPIPFSMALMAIWHFLSKINRFQTAIEKNVNGSVWQ
jgi:hypothetical protein